MKTYKELVTQWSKCQGSGQVLVDHNHPLRMYLNINTNGNKELLIPIESPEKRFKSTLVIGINNYHNDNKFFWAIELLNSEYEEEYISLCFDLIESSRTCADEQKSRIQLFEVFKKWLRLFEEPPKDILPEKEIKGLIGELSYICEEIDLGRDCSEIIQAWTVHKDSSRDFIFDDTWAEIKTIESTKDYITISSIEQLDNDVEGTIEVYKLIREKETESGAFSLNDLVDKVKTLLDIKNETVLNYKLLSKGYSYNEKYKDYCYSIVSKETFDVKEDFPRLRRIDLPEAISSAKYDIKLAQIERWRVDEK